MTRLLTQPGTTDLVRGQEYQGKDSKPGKIGYFPCPLVRELFFEHVIIERPEHKEANDERVAKYIAWGGLRRA